MEDDLVRGDNIANPRDSSQLLELEESSAESPSNRNMAARQNETDTQTHDQEDAIENSGYGRRPRKKVSKVWDDFEEYKVGGILIGIKCKHCKHVFKASKSGTTTQFKRHLQTCPRRSFVISGQPQLSLQVGSSTGNNLQPWKYDHSRIRELMSHMVMVHELPFKFAEYEVFNMLMKESYPEFRKVSRTTLKNDCIVSYNNEKKRLIALLNSVKRVSITTDIWRSGQKIEYMVITCHFVCEWKLHKRVLSFCHIPPPHNGVAVCEALNHCLNDWNLTSKLATVTADNATYNDVAIRKLKDVLSYQRKVPFDGVFFHVRCCAHIINLLVQDGLNDIEDIIHNVRETVKHIDKSSHRIKIFGDVVKSWHLPGKKLILDCPTRWNSTYKMLACALNFKDVFGDYEEKDPYYKNKPSNADWVKVEKICSFLQVFNDITEIISGTEYPTSNLFLPELAQIKEELDEKAKSDDDYIREMAGRMKLKFDKYWGDNNLLISVSAILDPRNKLKVIQFYSSSLYDSEFRAREYVSTVTHTLHELYAEYVELYPYGNFGSGIDAQGDGNGAFNNTNVTGKGLNKGRRKFDEFIRGSSAESSKSELDIYLDDGVILPEDMSDFFDPLDWWRGNSLKYRILSKLACDILAIPITSVASESTFSAGKRVIDPHRASLGVDTVQMLLCGEDWLRNFYNIKKKQGATDEEVKEILF